MSHAVMAYGCRRILVSLIVYLLIGGADYGGCIWDLLATGERK